MIFKHEHLTEKFLLDKSLITVDEANPLVVVLSDKFTFLNQFVVTALSHSGVHFRTEYTDEQQIMSYQLPAIAFKDNFLSQQALVEFLSDLILNKESFINMNERKNLIKDQYRKWFTIIKQEHNGLCRYSASLSSLGIHSQQDYFNHLFSQFLSIASWLKGDILERRYDSFKRTQANLQTLFFYDVIKSILKLCGKTQVDHILRAHFENLIEFNEGFVEKVETVKRKNIQQGRSNIVQVVVDKLEKHEEVQHPKLRVNWKRFAITFTVAAAVYAKWVE